MTCPPPGHGGCAGAGRRADYFFRHLHWGHHARRNHPGRGYLHAFLHHDHQHQLHHELFQRGHLVLLCHIRPRLLFRFSPRQRAKECSPACGTRALGRSGKIAEFLISPGGAKESADLRAFCHPCRGWMAEAALQTQGSRPGLLSAAPLRGFRRCLRYPWPVSWARM